MLSFNFVVACGLFEWKRFGAGFFFYCFVYICIVVEDPVIREGGLGSH